MAQDDTRDGYTRDGHTGAGDLGDEVRALRARVAELEENAERLVVRSGLYGATAVTSVLAVFLPLFAGSDSVRTIWEAAGSSTGSAALVLMGLFVFLLAAAALGIHRRAGLVVIAVASSLCALVLFLRPGTTEEMTRTPIAVTALVLYLMTAVTSTAHAAQS